MKGDNTKLYIIIGVVAVITAVAGYFIYSHVKNKAVAPKTDPGINPGDPTDPKKPVGPVGPNNGGGTDPQDGMVKVVD